MKTQSKKITEAQARKMFNREARYMREGVYMIRLGYAPRALQASDTEELWNKYWAAIQEKNKQS